jgi:hypothetical protein
MVRNSCRQAVDDAHVELSRGNGEHLFYSITSSFVRVCGATRRWGISNDGRQTLEMELELCS